jgi:catechol 2,3-dioxygenase-like lactoylglutathione lyase family enzyme
MNRFHHVGITVRDIETSYKFYRDIVGMRIWDQDAELGTYNPERTESVSENGDATFLGIKSAAFDELTDNPGSVFKYINCNARWLRPSAYRICRGWWSCARPGP